MRKIDVIDTTLRDGSYVINFCFTKEQTETIAAALENSGLNYIEVGHGLGLNASNSGYGEATETDTTYLMFANKALKRSKWGMFFIPGIGRKSDIVLAAENGMKFIRIGTNVTEVEKAKEYIKLAKSLGLEVHSNLMKSYALEPSKFIKCAKLVESYGVDVISLVDSAGGMTEKDVENYIGLMKRELKCKIGFHGHNNLLLANANSLKAAEMGADIVDGSLQGMGRSAGNAQTEVLVACLQKEGYDVPGDIFKLMDIGKKYVEPIMPTKQGIDDIGLVFGLAQFHSSFFNILRKVADEYQVDVRKLIIEVSKIEKINITYELAKNVAMRMKESLYEIGK